VSPNAYAERLPYPSRIDAIPLPTGPLDLWRPPKLEELLDAMIEGPPDPDEKLPYWADLWPAAVGLAEAIDDGTVPVAPQQEWLELGCGLGLVSLAAARRGARVTATDWIDEALRYVEASAELGGWSIATRKVDWRLPPPDVRPDRVLASDVLYEARNGEWLRGLLARWGRPGFEMWVSDPGRAHAAEFFAELEGFGCEPTERRVERSRRADRPRDRSPLPPSSLTAPRDNRSCAHAGGLR
jgi:predicted nicotinamide N-methyase